MTAPRIDAAALKQAATGKWPDILQRLGGIPAESLDGRHCACPKCGGTDRFRMIDPERGAVFCNQCFNKDNGDGLAALQWAKGCDFPTALRAVAEHLGMGGQTNGHTAGNGKVNGKKPDDLRAKVEVVDAQTTRGVAGRVVREQTADQSRGTHGIWRRAMHLAETKRSGMPRVHWPKYRGRRGTTRGFAAVSGGRAGVPGDREVKCSKDASARRIERIMALAR